MLTCPHCSREIIMRELPHEGFLANYRVCPSCGEKFTPDTKTKQLQAFGIFIGIISLGLTLLLYFNGTQWLIPALISYAAMGVLIYIGNKRIFLVPYEKDNDNINST